MKSLSVSFSYNLMSTRCLCSAFGEQNIGSGLQTLPRHLEMCSRNSTRGSGTKREFGRVGWSKRPCISAYHSLCRGSWAVWSAWCGQMGHFFRRTLWTWDYEPSRQLVANDMGAKRCGEHVIQPSTNKVGWGLRCWHFHLLLPWWLRGPFGCGYWGWLI